jgi:hypothetical protein
MTQAIVTCTYRAALLSSAALLSMALFCATNVVGFGFGIRLVPVFPLQRQILINLFFYSLVVTSGISSLYCLQLAAALLILAGGERDQCVVTSLLLLWALDIAPLDHIATHSTANNIREFLASWRYAMMLNNHLKWPYVRLFNLPIDGLFEMKICMSFAIQTSQNIFFEIMAIGHRHWSPPALES